MARLASQAKGGYYPTPPAEMALICARLRAPAGEEVNLLDPCCGEGLALRQMADALAGQGAAPHTFGVELEQTRADKARGCLDRVLAGGYEWLRASNEVFSALWLNPPFDEDPERERTEVRFLLDLTAPGKYLQPGGLLMYCVPRQSLTPAANYLAIRFRGIKVYRFTDANYPTFHQVVVFGYRDRVGGEEASAARDYLTAAGEGRVQLPSLDEDDGITFLVPGANGPVNIFRSAILLPEEILTDVEASPAWEAFEGLICPSAQKHRAVLKRPILPLKLAHLALAIAAGAVDGHMGGHLLEGVTRKVTDTYEETTDSGTVIRETERHVTRIRVFCKDGVFELV